MANGFDRVKLPKTFLAVNLSDAFSFQEKQNSESQETTQNSEGQEGPRDELQETAHNGDSDVLEMRGLGRGAGTTTTSTQPAVSAEAAGSRVSETETEHIDPAKEVEAAEQL